MFVFWDAITRPLFDAYKPRRIVEVGSDHGDNTEKLLEYAQANDAVVEVIDPLPKYDADEWCAKWGDRIVYHKALSLNVLHKIEEMDLVLIDGDHNWYTVRNELELIYKNTVKKGKRFPLVLMHDVGWPYGRRDLYYDPSTIPPAYLQPYRKEGMELGQAELAGEDKGLNPHLFNAIYENNLRNGVRTAAEDFVSDHESDDLRFLVVPCLNGLGIVFREQDMADKAEARAFIATLPTEGANYALVESLEQARLRGDLERIKLKRRLDAHKEKVTDMRARIEGLEANAKQVGAQLKEARESEIALEADLKSARAESAAAAARAAELSGEVTAAKGKLENLGAQAKELQSKLNYQTTFAERRLAEGKAVRLELEAKLKEAKADAKAAQDFEAQLKAAQSEIADLKSQLTYKTALTDRQLAESKALRVELEEKLKQVSASRAELKERHKSDVTALKADGEAHQARRTELEKHVADGQAKLAEAAKKLTDQAKALTKAEQARAKLETSLAATRVELRSCKSDLESAAADRDRNKRALSALESSVAGRVARRLNAYSTANPRQAAMVRKGAQAAWWTVSLQLPRKLSERRRLQQETALLKKSKLFDAEWYLQRYPDVAGAGVDPVLHYLVHGAANGRDPSPHFSTPFYRESYPNVTRNPLVDYLDGGAAAGRNPSSTFDSAAYLERYPDVAKAGLNPLVHYVRFGKAENRATGVNGAAAPRASIAPPLPQASRPPRPRTGPAVDIVLPVSGSVADIDRLLRALDAWRRPRGELVLVEDGVDPAARDLIDAYLSRTEDATLVRNLRARGLSASVNQGLAEVTSNLAVVITNFGPPVLRALDAQLSVARSSPDFLTAPLRLKEAVPVKPTHTDAAEHKDGVVGLTLTRGVLAKAGFLDEHRAFGEAREDWTRRALAAAPAGAGPDSLRMN